MNRIICDICGSEYSESADRCPICSYTRQGTEKVVLTDAAQTVRTKVKGGRYSAKNVKKRQKAMQAKNGNGPEKDPNRPLIITIILLLIAILLVGAYIAVRFFRGRDALQGVTTRATTLPTETTLPPEIPCAAIEMDLSVVDLEVLGEQRQLEYKLLPEDTTDTVIFSTANEKIVTVTDTGLLTAVGSGQTTITITCGDQTKECTVVCWFLPETTAPPQTEPPETTTEPEPVETTKATEPTKATEATKAAEPAVLALSQTDVSLFALNESFTLRVSRGGKSISRSDVTWISSDPKVAAVENGVVTAVGKGVATITASYNGEEASCIVRCQFKDTSWAASSSDVTLAVGQSFTLSVTNNSGERADVNWTADKEGVVSVDGRIITGKAVGVVTLTAVADGVTLTCIVRVK